jgi:predicted ribonuclease YlaK
VIMMHPKYRSREIIEIMKVLLTGGRTLIEVIGRAGFGKTILKVHLLR